MPSRVVITGAFGHVGRVLLDRLWGGSAEVLAVVRKSSGLKSRRVVVDSLIGERATKAIRHADIVIHLAGAMRPNSSDTYYGANVATAAAVARAARDSNVKRIIALSPLGASEFSTNEFFRTRAQAERLLLETRIPTVIFRCSHVIGDAGRPGLIAGMLLSRDSESVKVLGTGRQIVTPVYVGDVAQAIIRAMDNGRTGVFELGGPERMSMDDLARLLNRDSDVLLQHLPERLAKFVPTFLSGFPPALIDLMMRPSAANPAETVRSFGVTLHSLRETWGTLSAEGVSQTQPSPAIVDMSV